jgi:ABC-type bacteriocin/lantibiotic exporter with double-glycine peptidase domain
MTSESALFYKDLYYNIIYGIDEKKLIENKKKIMEEIIKYMTLFGLDKFIPTMTTTNAHNISKGQTQRVAIVRLFIDIIFKDIRILFLDEFTSNIDNKMEEIIYTELRNIQKIYNFTTFYVSHNNANKKYSDYSYEIDVDTHSINQFETII